tara:strand:+ start:2225 stop:2686 length:462 start_codon:yes stop_codon:yes gene_type:complete
MGSKVKWRAKRLDPAVHHLFLVKHNPNGESKVSRGRLLWEGYLTPTPLSQTYKVRIRYRPGDTPDVQVLEPKLRTSDHENLPHIYPGDRLCLYYPGEWNGSEQIGETIIPWVAEWLYHYEIWRATGTWSGGGEHPKVKSRNKPRGRDDVASSN